MAVTLAQLSEVTLPLTLPLIALDFALLLLIPTPLLLRAPTTPAVPIFTVVAMALVVLPLLLSSLCNCLVLLVLLEWVREHMQEAPLSQ